MTTKKPQTSLNTTTLKEIQEAHDRIRGTIHETPVFQSKLINEITGGTCLFKCENLQKTGSFKIRGALNAILTLSDEEKKNGVITHSSGNHGQALSYAASLHNIPAWVVIPEDAPKVKQEAAKSYGANVVLVPRQNRQQATDELQKKHNLTYISSFNFSRMIEGQGTAVIELLNKHPECNLVLTPLGGGGLLSGTAIAAKAINPTIKVIGVEPKNANEAEESLAKKQLCEAKQTFTIADGLRMGISDLTFEIISSYVDDVLSVSDQEIINAMALIWERLKIVIEPSSAVTLAAILSGKIDIKNKTAGMILTGGNVDAKAFITPYYNV